MSVSDGHAKLIRAAKDLFAKWDRLKESWRDDNCRQFEKKYLDLLQVELHKTQQEMEHIEEILFRIHKECT